MTRTKCEWMSTKPGVTSMPVASTSSAPVTARLGPTAEILPAQNGGVRRWTAGRWDRAGTARKNVARTVLEGHVGDVGLALARAIDDRAVADDHVHGDAETLDCVGLAYRGPVVRERFASLWAV